MQQYHHWYYNVLSADCVCLEASSVVLHYRSYQNKRGNCPLAVFYHSGSHSHGEGTTSSGSQGLHSVSTVASFLSLEYDNAKLSITIILHRLACELHLQASISSPSSLQAIESFVSDDAAPPRLFVWISKDSEEALASTEKLEKHNVGAIAFVRGASSLQCMTIQPRIYQEEEEKGDEAAPVESSTALDALQLYTRYCFVQAVQTTAEDDTQEQSKRLLEGLQDKIRQLDVALGQYRRSAFSQIPSITLQVHPLLEEASKKGTTDLDALGLADKLEDDDFLNEVQSGVTQWIVQIRKVTTLSSTTPFPSLESSQAPDTEEVSFWTQLEAALQHVQHELKKPGVELTLNLLKAAKRFLATIALDNNSGLEGSLAHTLDVCHFLRNYPSLESAGDFDKLCTGMNGIFDHLPKIRSSRYYDLERMAKLLEASTYTLCKRMTSILRQGSADLVWMDYEKYETQVRYPTQDVFVQFDDRYGEFTEFFLEQGRRRKMASGKTPAQVIKELTLHHAPLQQRLDVLHEFRANHELLRKVVTLVLKDESGTDAIRQVEDAPRTIFASIDFLDLSPGGTSAMERALEEYERQMDAMEERLARLLRDKLTACEVSRVCE